jgi:glycosyl-4,4'-diaponeurosporenoate acyltransferase
VVPLVDLPLWLRATLNVGGWLAWSAVVGLVGHRRPLASFAVERWWSRARAVEREGKLYEERLHIRAWKDRLPEAGAVFAGGFAKRQLLDPDRGLGGRRAVLERYVVETRRAEWVHWVIPAATPVFLVWNDGWVAPLMVLYAVAANGPCLVVQRYNRARLQRVLARQPR